MSVRFDVIALQTEHPLQPNALPPENHFTGSKFPSCTARSIRNHSSFLLRRRRPTAQSISTLDLLRPTHRRTVCPQRKQMLDHWCCGIRARFLRLSLRRIRSGSMSRSSLIKRVDLSLHPFLCHLISTPSIWTRQHTVGLRPRLPHPARSQERSGHQRPSWKASP